jgi:WD40 repeat protein
VQELVKEVTVRRMYAVILLILPFSVCLAQDRSVLLAAGRAGRVEVLDPTTLETLGSIKVLPQTDGITSDRTGVLFLREGLAPEFRDCCALYALDLKTHEMTKLIEPAFNVTVSPEGKQVLTQRGNVGIEVFSVRTLQQEPGISRSIAPGVYGLNFSSDGRLLFAVSNFPTPTLEIFDFAQRKVVQRFSAPRDFTALGTSISDAYYLYGYRNGTGQLRRVKADNSALEEPVTIDFPDIAPECNRWVARCPRHRQSVFPL